MLQISDLELQSLPIRQSCNFHKDSQRFMLTLVQAKDELRNRRLCGGDTFVVHLEGPSSVEGSVEDHNDGTYTATYQACVAGDYVLSITNGSSPVLPQHTHEETDV